MEKSKCPDWALVSDYITPQEAAHQVGVHAESIRRWARTYGIGRKVVGRYRVDPSALAKLVSAREAIRNDAVALALGSGVAGGIALCNGGEHQND